MCTLPFIFLSFPLDSTLPFSFFFVLFFSSSGQLLLFFLFFHWAVPLPFFSFLVFLGCCLFLFFFPILFVSFDFQYCCPFFSILFVSFDFLGLACIFLSFFLSFPGSNIASSFFGILFLFLINLDDCFFLWLFVTFLF